MCFKVYAVVRSTQSATQTVALYSSEQDAADVAATMNQRTRLGARYKVYPMNVLCSEHTRDRGSDGRTIGQADEETPR